MKKILITFLILFIYPLNFIAQNSLSNKHKISGKIVITKEGIKLNNSIELEKGTSLDFEFDGTSLDLSIGTELYEDVGLSSGMAIKLNGEACLYMTLSDGIDLGAFSFKTTEGTSSNAILNSDFKANLNFGPEFCVNWLDNKLIKLTPSIGNPQNLVSIPNTTKSLLSFLHYLKFDANFKTDVSINAEIKALSPPNISQISLNSYCLDWEKDTPNPNTPYQVSDDKIDLDIDTIENRFNEKEIIQDNIWLQQFQKKPSDIYLSRISMVKSKKSGVTYGIMTFLRKEEILIFRDRPTFLKYMKEFNSELLFLFLDEFIFEAENGEIIFSNLGIETINKLKKLNILSLEYIKSEL